MTTTPTSDLSTYLGPNPGLERIYDEVQATVPSVTLAMVKMATWNAIEQWFVRSTSQRRVVDWTMLAGVQAIDFNPFDNVWLVTWVLGVSGLPRFNVTPPALLEDLDCPSADRCGKVLLALKPVSFLTAMPPELFSTWHDAILDGVLFWLFRQPSKPYSSPQLAQLHGMGFRRGIAEARAIAQAGYAGGPGRWAFPIFAKGRRKN